jgi:hypothetical protein
MHVYCAPSLRFRHWDFRVSVNQCNTLEAEANLVDSIEVLVLNFQFLHLPQTPAPCNRPQVKADLLKVIMPIYKFLHKCAQKIIFETLSNPSWLWK